MKINLRNSLLAAAALFATGFCIFSSPVPASAQCFPCPDIGQLIPFVGTWGMDVESSGIVSYMPTQVTCDLRIVSCNPAPPSCPGGWVVNLDVASLSGIAHDPTLGTFTWQNDPSRVISPAATFISYSLNPQFPAFGRVVFYLKCQISGIPGDFLSTQPVTLVNSNVTSFNPFMGQTFSMDHSLAPQIPMVNSVTGATIYLNTVEAIVN